MARKVVVTVVDDHDGRSPAEETVSFALEGAAYEIDLSSLNAKQLRAFFEQWTPFARKVGRSPRTKANHSDLDRVHAAVVRAWAREHGHAVASRGRVPSHLAAAYTAANS
ncbi:Lsr2 family protein [Nocardia sp. NPDC050435]|uniref:histone-like nucleoid-structuring protein Lsr2 n=1 Tax=Nocardia sp. NPDC050435 TaxID=3155040 RepID=UPI0033DFAD77